MERIKEHLQKIPFKPAVITASAVSLSLILLYIYKRRSNQVEEIVETSESDSSSEYSEGEEADLSERLRARIAKNPQRRISMAYKKVQEIIGLELLKIQKPIQQNPIKPGQLIEINQIMTYFQKTYIQTYKEEVQERRISHLKHHHLKHYLRQKLADMKDEHLIFQEVTDEVARQLQVTSDFLLKNIQKLLQYPKYQVEMDKIKNIEAGKVIFERIIPQHEAIKMMSQVLDEAKSLLQGSEDVQNFVKRAPPEDLQEVLDGLLADLCYLCSGLKEGQYKKLNSMYSLSNERVISGKYEAFMEVLIGFRGEGNPDLQFTSDSNYMLTPKAEKKFEFFD